MFLRLGFELGFVDARGADVAIVLDEDGNIQLLLQLFLERDIFPIQVGREDHLAGFGIDGAGGADADRP